LTLIAMAFIILHARRVQANPQSSPVYDIDRARTDSVDLNNLPPFGAKEKPILLVFVLGMVLKERPICFNSSFLRGEADASMIFIIPLHSAVLRRNLSHMIFSCAEPIV